MKLRNKKTGKIKECIVIPIDSNSYPNEYEVFEKGDSLAELNKEWEDYKEPSKTIWQIKDSGELQDFEEDDFSDGYIESSKSIGNYFETEEEAEKAVEKLKAWKRLKDKGFEITDWAVADGYGLRFFGHYSRAGIKDELDLLFGGEE